MRVFLRVFVLVVAVAGSSLVVAGPATGQPYPIPGTGATVSAATVTVGGTVQVTAGGHLPGETVSVDVTYQPTALGPFAGRAGGGYRLVAFAPVMNTVADNAGNVAVTVTLTQTGTAVITLTGLTSGVTNVARVVVRPAGGALPVTGGDSRYLLWTVLIGAAVAAVGMVLIMLTRSRRRPLARD